jgi:signal transduction histidine kinase
MTQVSKQRTEDKDKQPCSSTAIVVTPVYVAKSRKQLLDAQPQDNRKAKNSLLPAIGSNTSFFLAAAQEAERKRIARDLHDVLGQNIVALKIGLSLLKKNIPRDSAALAGIKDLEELTTEMGKQVHYLTMELRPSSLDDLGLFASIAVFVEHWSDRFGISADFHNTLREEFSPGSLTESMVYRIVQEALTNVAKHARATRVEVIIERHKGQLIVLIEDNGSGFSVDSVLHHPKTCLGLQGMIERANMADGTLEIDSQEGNGTTVILSIPYGGRQP